MKNQVQKHEYDEYFSTYINIAPVGNILESLSESKNQMLSLLNTLAIEKWNYKYSEEKWTIKELMVHIIDTERIMAYRALRIARNDKQNMLGFEHDDYILPSKANGRTPAIILKEYTAQRESTLCLFENFTPEMLENIGKANSLNLSTRALGYIIAGHELHHLKVLTTRYL